MNSFIARYFKLHKQQIIFLITLVQSLFVLTDAYALPSFARQTGQNCVACHAGGQFPELTPYGRMFKLTGYTIGTRSIPLSAMGVISFTKSSNPDPADPAFAKDAVALFQTGSVFLAGKITNNIGVFAQATYNNYDAQNPETLKWEGKFASDNMDLRYADHFINPGNDLIIGASLNNNPTLADPWNTAPAWITYVPTQFGVTGPSTGPMISQLGQQASGLSMYAFWNHLLYAEVSAYRTANGVFSFMSQGTKNADQTKLRGNNPYVRLALNHEWGAHNAMLGVFGMNADIYPDNLNPSGPTTKFRDRGVDAQYQYILDPHTVTAQLSYIKETMSGGDITGYASNASNTINQLKLKASYIYQAKYGASLSYFSTTGSQDATLYSANASLTPDTRGWIPEIFWTPHQNVRVGAQYFTFDKFNSASSNYDGAGRNAKDNNTLFVYVWGAY